MTGYVEDLLHIIRAYPGSGNELRKELAIKFVRRHGGHTLAHFPEDLQDDKEVVLAAVKENGFALRFASDRLKDDEDIVRAAVRRNRRALRFASERLQKLLREGLK